MSSTELMKVSAAILKAYAQNEKTKEEHYNRNINNKMGMYNNINDVKDDPRWSQYPESRCHSFNGVIGNTKWVGEYVVKGKATESLERVFDMTGNRVIDPVNMATFNFATNVKTCESKEYHFANDVAPWIIWGNSECDTTTVFERARAYVNFNN